MRLTVASSAASEKLVNERSTPGSAVEATVSRIYNGNHTRIDQVAGENLGRDVAGFVLARALRR